VLLRPNHSSISLPIKPTPIMKWLLLSLSFLTLFALSGNSAAEAAPQKTSPYHLLAQGGGDAPTKEDVAAAEKQQTEQTGHAIIKEKFIEGDYRFMTPVLICLIIGLAVAIQRIIALNLKTVNSSKLIKDLEGMLKNGNVDKAQEYCRSKPGPVASVCYQALNRKDEGIDIVEKSIVSYGSVQMGLLEKGLVWISLFISLSPMLGFMGTVIGMIGAFDAIEAAGDISPSLVAGGIKVALLTTVAGLIVAIILQIFYNYLVSKIDALVNDMEDTSISLVDMLVKYNIVSNPNKK
jgi:biopolymer transport protein ExbB